MTRQTHFFLKCRLTRFGKELFIFKIIQPTYVFHVLFCQKNIPTTSESEQQCFTVAQEVLF